MKSRDVLLALGALAHEHRLGIFRMLVVRGPEGLSAGEIAERMRLPPSSLTFHTQALSSAGMIRQRRVGRQIIYSANFAAMDDLLGFLSANCCAAADADCSEVCAPLDKQKRRVRA